MVDNEGSLRQSRCFLHSHVARCGADWDVCIWIHGSAKSEVGDDESEAHGAGSRYVYRAMLGATQQAQAKQIGRARDRLSVASMLVA